ncbi:uncharacterized protein BDZ99DRAFT_526596 [Mytilinidion resinicola]|uniref:Uncharacterized protein n=1 Tax=Mytilinidion resinicola TaxID=574789 RepID=A0A6A6Y361_9PEZI|nr:uncharacterized protein BDZ99DRAFT_526596 [Mytilinidion resinicola]KAF2803222.1 hypothetical protein BDZ99DRAFT_526596 [Mytilinidion resinicola]
MSTEQDLTAGPARQSHDPPISRRGQVRRSKAARRHYRRHLENVQNLHKQLAKSREGLVIERVDLRGILEAIRLYRERAGNDEASFMTSLRQFCEQQGIYLPPDLHEKYLKVQAARDIIGKLEDDYSEAQKVFSASEWRFIEKEDDFYQYDMLDSFPEDSDENGNSEFSDSGPTTPHAISQPAAEDITERLTRDLITTAMEKRQLEDQFNGLREQEMFLMDDHKLRIIADFSTPPEIEKEKDGIQRQASVVIEKLVAVDVKERNLKQELLSSSRPSLIIGRRASDPSGSSTMPLPTANIETISRAKTESNLAMYGDENPSNRRRVGQWLLDTMDASSLEKARFKAFLSGLYNEDLDESSFWQIMIQRWNDETSGSSVARSGRDSQVSHVSAEENGSTAAGRERPSPSSSSKHTEATSRPPAIVKLAPTPPQIKSNETLPDSAGSSGDTDSLYRNARPSNQEETEPPTLTREDQCVPSPTHEETPTPSLSHPLQVTLLDMSQVNQEPNTTPALPSPRLDSQEVDGKSKPTLNLDPIYLEPPNEQTQKLRIQPEKTDDRPRSDPGDIGDIKIDVNEFKSFATLNLPFSDPFRRAEYMRTPPPATAEPFGNSHQPWTYTLNGPSVPSPPLTVVSTSSRTLELSRSASPMNESGESQEVRRSSRGELPPSPHRRSRSESNTGSIYPQSNSLPVPKKLPPEGPDGGPDRHKNKKSPRS